MIELAVALIIIAILLGSMLIPLSTQVESRNIEETQRIIARARDALLGYAAAYGYFPCPASATSNGQEARTDPPDFSAGTCHITTVGSNIYHGFLPAATLGLTPTDAQGYLLDGFSPSNRVRYAVSTQPVNSVSNPFTRINGIRNAGMANVSGAAGLIHVCNSSIGVNGSIDCGTAVTLSSNAIAVIWSVGSNQHPSAGINPPNPDEAQNPNANGGSFDRIFVSRTQSGSGAPGGTFDDIVEWIGPAILFNRLVQAGQLP